MPNLTPHRIVVNSEKIQEIISYLESRNVVVEMKNSKNYHLQVKGCERVVNFYPTTGSISCNPCLKYKKAFNLKGAKHETAIKRVVDLANLGY